MLTGITVLETDTNIPGPFQLNVDNVQGSEFSTGGMPCGMFLLGAGRNTTSTTIYKMSGDAKLGMQWMSMYPRYNAKNLREVIQTQYVGPSADLVNRKVLCS